RTTAGTTAAPTQKRAEEGPEGDHPAVTMQTSQGAVAASPQAPPAAGHTRADRPWARQGGQAPPSNRRKRASAHPSILPRSEKPATHRRPGASSTGRA
ncbi:hypothetical protein M9458_018395, partial [Cirrhinus mrigala]